MSQIKERVNPIILMLIVAVALFVAGYQTLDASQVDEGSFYTVADNTCPSDPGTCGSSGGG